jgi:hypothetical protein
MREHAHAWGARGIKQYSRRETVSCTVFFILLIIGIGPVRASREYTDCEERREKKGNVLNWRSGDWQPHMRWSIILHKCSALPATPAQPAREHTRTHVDT